MTKENQLNPIQKRALELLSALISKRKGIKVELNNIMDYENHRRDISEYNREDFITEGARGSLALSAGDIILSSDIKEEAKKNDFFFKQRN